MTFLQYPILYAAITGTMTIVASQTEHHHQGAVPGLRRFHINQSSSRPCTLVLLYFFSTTKHVIVSAITPALSRPWSCLSSRRTCRLPLFATKYCDSGLLLTHAHPWTVSDPDSPSVYLTCSSSFPPRIPLHPAGGQSNRQRCSPHILRASSTIAHKKSLNNRPMCSL
jgi:hypothetical protein